MTDTFKKIMSSPKPRQEAMKFADEHEVPMKPFLEKDGKYNSKKEKQYTAIQTFLISGSEALGSLGSAFLNYSERRDFSVDELLEDKFELDSIEYDTCFELVFPQIRQKIKDKSSDEQKDMFKKVVILACLHNCLNGVIEGQKYRQQIYDTLGSSGDKAARMRLTMLNNKRIHQYDVLKAASWVLNYMFVLYEMNGGVLNKATPRLKYTTWWPYHIGDDEKFNIAYIMTNERKKYVYCKPLFPSFYDKLLTLKEATQGVMTQLQISAKVVHYDGREGLISYDRSFEMTTPKQ